MNNVHFRVLITISESFFLNDYDFINLFLFSMRITLNSMINQQKSKIFNFKLIYVPVN